MSTVWAEQSPRGVDPCCDKEDHARNNTRHTSGLLADTVLQRRVFCARSPALMYTKLAFPISELLARRQAKGLVISAQTTRNLTRFINAKDSFAQDLRSLLARYPNVPEASMGFLPHWQRQPLWN